MRFGMTIFNQNIDTLQNYATRIQITLLFTSKLKMFMKTLPIILEKALKHQVISWKDHYSRVKKKSDWTNEI